MSTRWILIVGAALALLGATTAVAGPPLVCHPWITADAPPPSPEPWFDAKGKLVPTFQDEVLRALDAETETLVRMHVIQRVLVAIGDSGRMGEFLGALDARAKEKASEKQLASRRFDFALAALTSRFTGGSVQEESTHALVKAARALKGDPAASLAVARTVTPLMRSGSEAEHARAFVDAYDRARELPEGAAKERLTKVIAWDLDHLEAYLVDRELEASGKTLCADERLALLRRKAENREADEKK